jgi:hypothetical protein
LLPSIATGWLDGQPLAVLAHNGVFARKLKFARNPHRLAGLTDFLYQRDGEIIAFARPDLAVSGVVHTATMAVSSRCAFVPPRHISALR